MRKEELKRQYAANTNCLILNALCPKLKRVMYSEFSEEFEEKQKDERTGNQIVEDLIEKLKRR